MLLASFAIVISMPAFGAVSPSALHPAGGQYAGFVNAQERVHRLELVSEDVAQTDVEDRADIFALKAVAELQTGQLRVASDSARRALALDPAHPGALRVVAEIAEKREDMRAAREAWTRLAAVLPAGAERENVQHRIAELDAYLASNVDHDLIYVGDGDTDTQLALRVHGVLRGQARNVLIGAEARRFDASSGLTSEGEETEIDQTRFKGHIGLGWEGRHSQLTGRILGSNAGVGASAAISRDIGERYGLKGEVVYNDAYWAYSQGALNDAARDSILFTLSRNSKKVYVGLTLGASSYFVDDRDWAGDSLRGTFYSSVAWGKEYAPWRASYAIDAESFDTVRVRRTAANERFQPIPLTDREVHSLGIYKTFAKADAMGGSNRRSASVELGTGYRIDRKGEEGPFVSGAGYLPLGRKNSLKAAVEYSDVATQRVNTDGYFSFLVSIVRTFN